MNLENLNPAQQEAVKSTEGPLLVLAGAGSGKTKVLTTRIAYLVLEKGITPDSILAITFTNKAAKEMKERVFSMLGSIAYQIQISTFHSFGLLVLKEHYSLLGYQKNFTILDADDTVTVIKKILKDMGLDPKEYNPKAIKNKISGAKNELLDPTSYERYASTDFEEKVVQVYHHYQNRLVSSNSLDFDDLLMLPIILFEKNQSILKMYQQRFQYVLIDEYQDTNQAQYLLTKMISAKYKNICAVGDPDQTIYSWRGSNYRNILNFEKDYENPKVILLDQNYRSTENILNAANDIIKNNKQRKEKNLWTENGSGVKIKYHRTSDEKDEAYYVTKEIEKLLETGVSKNEIVILYRMNAQSRNLEETLLREAIPYKVVGSFYFYNRKEIKDLIAYLKLIYNPKDDVSLLRCINVPKRGIGAKTIENVVSGATANHQSIFETIKSGKEQSFKQLILELAAASESLSLTELVDLILEKSGIRQELESESSVESDVRLENLEEFKSITKTFEDRNGIVSLEEFLMEISLVADMEEHKDKKDVVTLMTVHSAKGLEFDYVFLVGMEEGVFPHTGPFMEAEELEEERRLCYVAVTRAKKQLWLINAKKRLLYGMDNYNAASRFIEEINQDYLETEEEIMTSFKNTSVRISNAIDQDASYTIGDHIYHDSFGTGVVVGLDKSVVTIAFPHPHGIKKLMKGHKSIRKVGSYE